MESPIGVTGVRHLFIPGETEKNFGGKSIRKLPRCRRRSLHRRCHRHNRCRRRRRRRCLIFNRTRAKKVCETFFAIRSRKNETQKLTNFLPSVRIELRYLSRVPCP